ncbi:SWIM zinc finger family protein [Halobacteriales archaeon Cl-PHB]
MPRSDTPTRKRALAPDLRQMPARAARAWAERMAVRHLGGARYVADSQSGATYVVDLETNTCTCPDHQIRGETCKLLRRVAIEITSRRVPPPGKRAAVCPACQFDPGEVVRDRETGDRLVVRRVTDRRTDETVIPAADTTVADYPTNEGYPADDLVVRAVDAGDLARTNEPRVYAFPHSCLEAVDDVDIVP